MFNIKNFHPLELRKKLRKRSINWRTADEAAIVLMAVGVIALFALIWYQVRPLHLVDIKVPVSTEKPTYRPGENVNGIFFGQVYYEGEVRISRDVFCAEYRGRILTDTGNEIFTGVSRPTKLEGALRTIGRLPDDVPVGKNCIVQFVNTYEINTPFGVRNEQRTYFTQNFLIISDEPESEQADLEVDQPQRRQLFDNENRNDTPTPDASPEQSPSTRNTPQPQPQEQPQPPTHPPAEPVAPETCAIDILGIRLFCG